MDPIASVAATQMFGIVIFGIIVLLVIAWCYKLTYPSMRYQNYLMSYKIGRLVKHAKEKQIDFVFEKAPRTELQIIDDQFEKDVRMPELEEIELSKKYLLKK